MLRLTKAKAGLKARLINEEPAAVCREAHATGPWAPDLNNDDGDEKNRPRTPAMALRIGNHTGISNNTHDVYQAYLIQP